MTKRRPFGSRDPNVQQRSDGESVTSSVPSVEEALRLRRRKKKPSKTKTTLADGNDSGFLITSTSKTPRISNRTKQLPPRRGGATKQLRRLEQSMASRAKQQQQQQQQQQQRTSLSSISTNTTTNRQDSTVTKRAESATGVKRKERSDGRSDDASQKAKKLKQPVADETSLAVDDIDKHPVVEKTVNETNVSLRSIDSHAKSPMRKHNNREEHVGSKKRVGCSVSAESRHDKHRDSHDKATGRSKELTKDDTSGLQRPQRLKSPAELQANVSSTQVTQDANERDTTMDCTSDDESLQLSPQSSTASPVQEKTTDDKTWALKLSVGGKRDRQQNESSSESEDAEQSPDNVYPRLSMTTHAENADPLESSLDLSNESRGELPESMEDLLRRESRGPIVTKGMLSRARESKADNEQVVDAMMKSGPSYKGRLERSPTPEGSMIGTIIGVNPHERSDSADDCSEVTMLTTDSYLNGFAVGHTTNLHPFSRPESRPDDEFEDSTRVGNKKKEKDRMASPDDVSAVPEVADRRSHDVSSVREPQDEGNQVVYFEHNGSLIPHPALPSGWLIKVSKTKQRLFYCHPDHGTSWHCPIVVPQQFSSDPIFKSLQQPSAVNVPVQQKETVLEDGDDTESEDSEMWSRERRRNKDGDAESVVERQSQASSRGGQSGSTTNSATKGGTMEGTEDYGSEVSSLASSVVDKGKRAITGSDGGIEPRESPLVEEEQVAALQLQKDTHTGSTSSELSPDQEASKLLQDRGHASRSSASFSSDISRQQVARVSLVETEATTEELSPVVVVEELVSIAHFRQNDNETGSVTTQTLQGVKTGGGDDDELVQTDGSPSRSTESTKLHRERDKDGEWVETNQKTPSVDPEDKETEPVAEDLALDDTDLLDTREEEDASEPTEEEKLEVGRESVGSSKVRQDDELLSTPDTEIEPTTAVQTEQIVELVASNHKVRRTNTFNEVALQENISVNFETEVDDAVFGEDHDIDLSPQAKRLSPIKHMNSFDNGDKPLSTTTDKAIERDDETVLETPVDDTSPLPPPPTNDSPLALLDDSFDDDDAEEPLSNKATQKTNKELDTRDPLANLSVSTENNSPVAHSDVGGDEYEQASPDDEQDDQLSVESSFNETTSTSGPLATNWRGYSHRIRNPPHPICALINIEALIERALRREERRKKAKKKRTHKSSRSERHKTSTKLVFD